MNREYTMIDGTRITVLAITEDRKQAIIDRHTCFEPYVVVAEPTLEDGDFHWWYGHYYSDLNDAMDDFAGMEASGSNLSK